MERNLVLIHLESLNNLIYKMNESFFPTIKALEKKAIVFPNYFSTATSTLMVIGDILYGGMEQYEQCKSLDYVPESYPYSNSLFDELESKGYQTRLLIYPNGGDLKSAEERHLAGFRQTMELKTDYQEYLNAIDESISPEKPFAIMACNYCSNLSLCKYTDLAHEYDGTSRWENGYRMLDQSVGDILNLLDEKGCRDNTSIILYGDHGDDYWQHGMHSGLTHGIEPYANLIHTPFMIVDSRIEKRINDSDLVCAEDVRYIIKQVIENEKIAIQTLSKRREIVLSRGSYAAQPIRENSFNKSYAITDSKFLFLVSHNGLELYDIWMDPTCTNNLLRFFMLENDIIKVNENCTKENKYHFQSFMNAREVRLLRQRFYYFKTCLYENVLRLYRAAGKTSQEMEDEMNFNEIHLA